MFANVDQLLGRNWAGLQHCCSIGKQGYYENQTKNRPKNRPNGPNVLQSIPHSSFPKIPHS